MVSLALNPTFINEDKGSAVSNFFSCFCVNFNSQMFFIFNEFVRNFHRQFLWMPGVQVKSLYALKAPSILMIYSYSFFKFTFLKEMPDLLERVPSVTTENEFLRSIDIYIYICIYNPASVFSCYVYLSQNSTQISQQEIFESDF